MPDLVARFPENGPEFEGGSKPPTPEQRAASVRAALARGDLLGAYDGVVRRDDIAHQELNYLEVLTLARLGDTERGLRLYGDYNLAGMGDVDSLSLKARLLKDQAFAAEGLPEPVALEAACRLYAAVYRRTRSSYPAINAATLALIAGRSRLAASLAREVVRETAPELRKGYFALATLAEALVVLGDHDGATAALSRAMQAPDADVGARSTTALQLQRLASALGPSEGLAKLMALIAPPRVAMFCGNIFVGDPALEGVLAEQVDALIVREKVGFAYGALAAGSDILIAERLLASKTQIPHFYLQVEIDSAPLMDFRAHLNANAEKSGGVKYTVNDFILKSVIRAAQAQPAINAAWDGDAIVKFKSVGLCVAIAIDDGLVTPVI